MTTLTRKARKFVFVVDPEEVERLKSHTGDEVLVPDEEMLEAYAGGEKSVDRVVLNADEFGVWVSGFAPIKDSSGETVGVVCADSPPRLTAGDGPKDRQPLTLASFLGEAGRRIARAEFEATTDGLTGVYNHRYLHEHLEEEIARATLHGTELVLLFVDIDHFKRFNDLWGHSVGDAALRGVAHVIQGEVRRGDVVARYGGEEFVAVLAESGQEAGRLVAERIRRRIAGSVLVPGTSAVTVSIGLAVFPADGACRSELLEHGDLAMYHAKRLGRDRVHAFSVG
jgi:diguanylate cyclase (GGDEF)-like protein